MPYGPEHYGVFLDSARFKHGMTCVLGPGGEESPSLDDEDAQPSLVPDVLPDGEPVYRLVPAPAPSGAERGRFRGGRGAGRSLVRPRGLLTRTSHGFLTTTEPPSG